MTTRRESLFDGAERRQLWANVQKVANSRKKRRSRISDTTGMAIAPYLSVPQYGDQNSCIYNRDISDTQHMSLLPGAGGAGYVPANLLETGLDISRKSCRKRKKNPI